MAKVSHSSKILFTCIWKVPLDYFDNENEDGELDPSKIQGPGALREWSNEQVDIMQSFGPDE